MPSADGKPTRPAAPEPEQRGRANQSTKVREGKEAQDNLQPRKNRPFPECWVVGRSSCIETRIPRAFQRQDLSKTITFVHTAS
jgi:hypothetical protein